MRKFFAKSITHTSLLFLRQGGLTSRAKQVRVVGMMGNPWPRKRQKPGWRESETGLKYRDRTLRVTLPKLRCLEPEPCEPRLETPEPSPPER